MAFNEQQVLYDYEVEFCKRLKPVLKDLGAARIWDNSYRQGREAAQPHMWQLGGKDGDKDWRKKTHVIFDGFFYNEEDPDVGKPIVQMLGEPRVIYSRVIDSDVEYVQEVDESTASAREEWEEDEWGVEFNVTNKTTVKAEANAEFAGAGASASAESETTTSLNTSFAGSSGGRNSKNVSLAIKGTFTVPAYQAILSYAEAQKQQITTPFKVNGYIDHAVKIDLYDWVEDNSKYLWDSKDGKYNVIECANLTELRSFLEGERVAEYPNMRNFLKTCSKGSRDFYQWLKDSENRHRQFERQKIVVAEQATEVKVKLLDN